MMTSRFDEHFAAMPIVAILRGITPGEVEGVARVLMDEGIRLIEIPLNTPKALESIARLSNFTGREATIGAGTVTVSEEVSAVADVGGTFIVSPHCDPAIVEACLIGEVVPVPGIRTTTEAFLALRAGARILKFFPATLEAAPEIAAMRAVLPQDAHILAVGGINAANAKLFRRHGAGGLGGGSSLFKPGKSVESIRRDVRGLIESWATDE